MKLKTILLTALVVISMPVLLRADSGSEIDHLIAYVRSSKATFIRNGQESTPNDAADHLQKKRGHFQKEIHTAEDFIQRAASQSILTGRPYLVRTEDGRTSECSTWLLEELGRFRSAGTNVANNASPANSAPSAPQPVR